MTINMNSWQLGYYQSTNNLTYLNDSLWPLSQIQKKKILIIYGSQTKQHIHNQDEYWKPTWAN